MKFSTVACTLALAGSALAAPGTALRRARNLAARKSRTLMHSESPATNKTNVSYSDNWGGAVLIGEGYTSVTGTFNAPSPSSDGSGSAWVGLDGDTCQSAILQTGIDWTYSNGDVSYDAWYEWFPDYEYNFDGITINAGDSITVTVTSSGTTSGTATVTNNSNGDSVTHDFTDQQGDLCGENAEWIVEDYEEGSSLVPFADYGSITFVSTAVAESISINEKMLTIYS